MGQRAGGLNALTDKAQPKAAGQCDGAGDYGGRPTSCDAVAIHRPDERLVELEVVNGQLGEVGKRGVARAVVVDGDSQPRLAEAFEYLNALRTIAHQDRFGDLQMERGGWQVEVRQECVDERLSLIHISEPTRLLS